MTELTRPQARRILREVTTRASTANKVDFDSLLFAQQRAFVEDPAKLKAAVCSRRAGKSEGIAHLVLKEMLARKDVLLPYICLTTRQGKQILWPVLRRLNQRLELNLKFNENDLTCRAPNGSQVFIVGGSEASELERLRGPKYPGVVIDEAQAYGPFLRETIKEIIEPATMDYNGWIALTGTPNAACNGYFFDLTNGRTQEKCSTHRWTAADNPFIADVFPEWIASRKKERNWTDSTPTYMREWLGQWVRDEDGLIYRIRPYNLVSSLPDVDDWSYVLGIDLGYADSTAFVVLAYSPTSAKVVVVESYKQSGLIPSAVAAHVEALRERFDFDAIVADSGGLGKGYVEEMKQRFGLPILAAEKQRKHAFIEILNGDLHAGVLEIVEGSNQYLIHEASLLQWREDSIFINSEGNKNGKPSDQQRKEDPRFDNHLCDAFLYAYRHCRQWMHEPEHNPAAAGTPEWHLAEQEAVERADEEEHRKSTATWWEMSDEDEANASVL